MMAYEVGYQDYKTKNECLEVVWRIWVYENKKKEISIKKPFTIIADYFK